MTEVAIRMVRPSDAEALYEIMSQPGVVWGTLQLPHQTPEAWRKRLEGNDGQFDYGLVALIDAKVVGMGSLHRNRRPRNLHVADFGISVHPEYQGQGVGKALLGALVEAADKWLNIRRIELEVYPDNERAIKLYQAFGFVEEGRKRMNAFRDGEYVDSIVMGRIRPGV